MGKSKSSVQPEDAGRPLWRLAKCFPVVFQFSHWKLKTWTKWSLKTLQLLFSILVARRGLGKAVLSWRKVPAQGSGTAAPPEGRQPRCALRGRLVPRCTEVLRQGGSWREVAL